MIAIQETAGGVSFAVKVQPRGRRNAVIGEFDGALKITLKAPPVDGRANDACVEFLAESLEVLRSAIEIVSGHSNRKKIVRVRGISAEEVRARLGV